MREIAEHAGVYEPMIYRRVGSKAELFEAVVLEPLAEVVAAHVARADAWRQAGPMSEVGRSWIESVYPVIRENRDLLLALMATERFHRDEFGDQRPMREGFRRLILQTEPEAELEASRRGLRVSDIRANMVANVGLLLGVALVEGLLAEDGADDETGFVGDHRMTTEMLQYMQYGVLRPGPDEQADQWTRVMTKAEIDRLLDRVADAERRAVRAELELELYTRDGRATEPPPTPSSRQGGGPRTGAVADRAP
jgi:AcrR family transcriptional regulator